MPPAYPPVAMQLVQRGGVGRQRGGVGAVGVVEVVLVLLLSMMHWRMSVGLMMMAVMRALARACLRPRKGPHRS